jgi:predicted RNase H-like HicB family nuclease
MTEIIFLVEEDPEGGYIAKALGESIFTQADSLQELREHVRDAVHCHFLDEQSCPKLIRLHIVRDEVIAS